MDSIRRLPVPFDRASRRPGQGHLVPDLGKAESSHFLRLPGLKPFRYGMIAFLGEPVHANEVIERWEASAPLPVSREAAFEAITTYFQQLMEFKVGNLVEITHGPGGFILTKIADTPHFPGPSLPG
jgi:hypothetical protein